MSARLLAFQNLTQIVFNRFYIVVGRLLKVFDAKKAFRRNLSRDCGELLSSLGAEFKINSRRFRQMQKPFSLDAYAVANKPRFADDGREGFEFTAISPVNGRKGIELIGFRSIQCRSPNSTGKGNAKVRKLYHDICKDFQWTPRASCAKYPMQSQSVLNSQERPRVHGKCQHPRRRTMGR